MYKTIFSFAVLVSSGYAMLQEHNEEYLIHIKSATDWVVLEGNSHPGSDSGTQAPSILRC